MKSVTEPFVSVVTPFYNTEEYLQECIESVISQTYQNWEYILVNNCSSDRSAKIALKYAKMDERIHFFHNDNFLNQLQNYNHALHQISSTSKYCKIIQADDWMFPECLSRMVEIAELDPDIGIVSSFVLKGNRISNVGLQYKDKIFNGHDICRLQLMGGGFYFGSPSSILIRSDIIRNRNPFYNENRLHSDTDACYEVLKSCKFGFVHQILSFSRTQKDSIQDKIKKFDPWVLDRFINFIKYGNFFLNSNEYKNSFRIIRNEYYKFLSKSLFERRGKKFWNFHKTIINREGYKIEYPVFFKFILLEVFDIITNPRKAAKFFSVLLRYWNNNKGST